MDESPIPAFSPASAPVGSSAVIRRIPWKLVAIYLGFSVVWTIITGFLPALLARDDTTIAGWEICRDGLFILLSAALLVFSIRHYVRHLEAARLEIGASEANYRQLIDTASDAIVVVNMKSGHFVQHNRKAESLFGATAEELKRLGPVELSPEFQPDGRRSSEKARDYLREAVEGGQPVFEWMHRSLAGRDIPCEIRLLRMPGGDDVLIRGSMYDITERRKAQAALRESERQLALILNNATDMMLLCKVEPGGVFRVMSVNRTYLNAVNAAGFKVGEGELVGRTLQEINEDVYRFPPEYNRVKHERFLTVISSRQVLSYDDVHDTPAGRSFGETVLTPLLDGNGMCTAVLYCSRDVTGQRRAAEALARSEENYRTLFEQATDAIFLFSDGGRVSEVNRRAVQLTGFAREELLGKDMFGLVFHDDHEMLRDCLGRILTEGAGFNLYRYQRKDGSVFPGETNTRLLPDGRLLAMARDISERRGAEEQRTRLEKELRQAQKIQAIGTLAGGIAHDFNNILAAILGNAQLLNLTLPSGHEGHSNVSQILVASHRAKDLVQQILLFSRQREQSRQLLQLEPLLDEAVKLITVSLPSSIRLEMDVGSPLPAILADPTQIHQVVVNLCTNAMHAMRERGGILTVSLAKALLPGEDSGSKPNLPAGCYLCLTVADTGHGMDADTLERIYEPFFTTKPLGEGTGLGLAVVHGIVQSNDGAIAVDSVPGEGTRFRLYFPARTVKPGTAQPWPLREIKSGAGQHIVFVDDEIAVAEVARLMLNKLGYRVTVFTDPRQARDFLQNDGEVPSLLMTDLSMPGLSGIDLIRLAIRRRPELSSILLTGYGKAFDPAGAEGLNIFEVIHKPFTMEQLSSSVEQALQKS